MFRFFYLHTVMKTFIKWQGSKTRYIKHITPLLPEKYNTYIEPFIGSGALILHLQPKKWVINDLNSDLINAWNLVKKSPEEIIKKFKEYGRKFIPLNREDKKLYCRELMKKMISLPSSVERTILYLFLTYCAYSGVIYNSKGFFFNSLDMRIYITNRCFFLEDKYNTNLKNASVFLNNASGKIYNKDYKDILSKAKKNDFVFMDPPYIEDKNYGFNYNKDEKLDNKFITDLLLECKKLDKKEVMWLMTQSDTHQVRKTFKDYKITEFKVYRAVTKTYTTELIIKNY